jgi:hypothetical protein
MAKFRVSPELVKVLLPVLLPVLKDLAAKTATTVDDRLVAAVDKALANPVLFALLLSLLAGDEPKTLAVASEDIETVGVLAANVDLLCGLLSVAVAPEA